MKKLKLTGKELRSLGYPQAPVISVAMQVMEKNYKHSPKEDALEILKEVLEQPENFLQHEILQPIAKQLIPPIEVDGANISLNKEGVAFNIFGRGHIEEGALNQMYQAAKLPIAVAGALMPDAHSGYGLPIGGVLAVENAVIPYGVGVDIGCRMCLSVYAIDPQELKNKERFFTTVLEDATLFGSGAQYVQAAEHEIMDHPLFFEMPLLKGLHGRAWKQLGTSGSGNHFAEFGIVTITEEDELLGLPPGTYVGLLTHSGSRGMGAVIANHYTRLAISKRRLLQEAKNLAWLALDEDEGREYWMAMNLAGDYASACHHVIHDTVSQALGEKPIKRVENHHNFAWKEQWDGREVVVHRKGATPAGKNVLGIIPGSMTGRGYIVKGTGETAGLNSASHGAGRKMSRSKAIESITEKQFREEVERHGVTLLGGGLDEAPFAYKNLDEVMKSQKALVDVVGSFTPKIVKMDGAAHRNWKQMKKNKETMN